MTVAFAEISLSDEQVAAHNSAVSADPMAVLVRRVKERCARSSLRRVAAAMGVPYTTLDGVVKHGKTPRPHTRAKMIAWLEDQPQSDPVATAATLAIRPQPITGVNRADVSGGSAPPHPKEEHPLPWTKLPMDAPFLVLYGLIGDITIEQARALRPRIEELIFAAKQAKGSGG